MSMTALVDCVERFANVAEFMNGVKETREKLESRKAKAGRIEPVMKGRKGGNRI